MTLGSDVDPGGVPSCADALSLGTIAASANGDLVAAPAPRSVALPLSSMEHPVSWEQGRRATGQLLPVSAATLSGAMNLPFGGPVKFWLGGSIPGEMELLVDERTVGSVRHQLNSSGQFVLLGSEQLDAGPHQVTLQYSGADLHPGSAADPAPIGPLIATQVGEASELTIVSPERAGSLCDQRWDWIEVRNGRESGGNS